MPDLNIEYFPEQLTPDPEECMLCQKDLHKGDTVIELQYGYVCTDCKTKAALKGAARDDLIEFITSCNLEEQFTQWYYGDNIKTLTVREMEDIYERI